MDYGDESYDEPMPMEILEDINDGSQSCPNINRIEARYKIHDCIKKRQSERKKNVKSYANHG